MNHNHNHIGNHNHTRSPSLCKPTLGKFMAPLAIFLYFSVVTAFMDLLSGAVILALPAFILSLPFAWLLKYLGLWSTVSFFDSAGPTYCGYLVVMVLWMALSYIIACGIIHIKRKIRE